jgi:two-component system LytT family response regulator
VRGHEQRAARLQEHLRSLLHSTSLPAASTPAPAHASSSSSTPPPRPFLERLLVTIGDRSIVIDLDDVTWIRADDYCVTVFTARSSHVMRESLSHLAERLDPAAFMRVHRSAIVRLASVRTLDRSVSGQAAVVLRDGTRVPISRSRREAILEALGALRG